MLVEGGL